MKGILVDRIFLNNEVVGVVMENQRRFSYAVPCGARWSTGQELGILPRWPPVQEKDPEVILPGPSTESGVGSLTIHSKPSGAQVLVDDQIMGTTVDGSLTLKNLEPDEYDITVRKKDSLHGVRASMCLLERSRSLTAPLQEGPWTGYYWDVDEP